MDDATLARLTHTMDVDVDRLSTLIDRLYKHLAPFRLETDEEFEPRPLDESPAPLHVECLRDLSAAIDLANIRLAQLLAELGG